MKNPLGQLYNEILKVFWRCPYWRRCPNFDRDKCYDVEVKRACGKYRKYEDQDAEHITKLHEELLKEGKLA